MTSIVTAYNSKVDMTLAFLDAMQRNTRNDAVEMILVNGGCQTKIEHPFITRRIDLERNIGFCHTLNHGLQAATGDYIFFVGNDSFPVDDTWLSRLIDLRIRSCAWMVCPANDVPGMEFRRDCYYADLGDYWYAHWFPSIAWLMAREDFQAVGLLDEGYVRTGMFADNDYCDRVRELGGLIAVSKDILLRHLCSQEGAALGTQSADMQVNSVYYAKKCAERCPRGPQL